MEPAKTAKRFVSVDVLRGLTIAFMILVNDPGDGRRIYAPLEHANWNGWTPTDLVFPNFLFLIGCSIVFSVDGRLRRGVARHQIALQMLRRTLFIFAIQFVLAIVPRFHFAQMRIFGVLTRIAICSLLAGLLYLYVRRWRPLLATVVALLVGYWALMRFVPVPGFGLPGRDIPISDEVGNLTSWVDRGFTAWTQRWMHTGVLYRRVSDPEGVLSTLPAIGTALLGVLAGQALTTQDALAVQRDRWSVARLLAIAALVCLTGGLLWNLVFPINKNLWSSSFVLLAGGFSFAGLALMHSIFDVLRLGERHRGVRALSWPLLIFGSNAIVAYVVSEVLVEVGSLIHYPGAAARVSLWRGVYQDVFARHGSTQNTSLLFAIAFVVLCFLPNWLLWRKRILVRV